MAAAAAEAGGRREGAGRGRSPLARLLTGCPAGTRRRTGLEPGGGAGGSGVKVVGGGEARQARMTGHQEGR